MNGNVRPGGRRRRRGRGRGMEIFFFGGRRFFLTFGKNIFFWVGGQKYFWEKNFFNFFFFIFFFTITTTTHYYHQQPPRGTFCSPRAHTFLFHTRKKNSASRNFFKLTKKKSLKNEQLGQKCAWMFGMGRLVDGRNL